MKGDTEQPTTNDASYTESPSQGWGVLDESSQRILLLLSSGQSLSIHEIARALVLEMESVWKDLVALERSQLIATSNGRIRLGSEGLRLLEKWGIIKPGSTPSLSAFDEEAFSCCIGQ